MNTAKYRSTFTHRALAALSSLAATALAAFTASAATMTQLVNGPSDIRVAPLVEASWAQGNVGGSACYNSKTPENCLCGCVATASGQIMRKWQYPTAAARKVTNTLSVNGVSGSYTMLGGPGVSYDWANMPLNPAGEASLTTAQRNAVGTLLYDIGVAANMTYTMGSSATYTAIMYDQFTETFGYSNAAIVGNPSGTGLTLEQFTQAILPSLDAGMPVLVGIGGANTSHSVICDGYGYQDGELYIHINMGQNNNSTDPATSFNNTWYKFPTAVMNYTTKEYISGNGVSLWPSGEQSYLNPAVYNISPTMRRGWSIVSGRVFSDATDSVPLSGATVEALNTSGGTVATATSNAKGIYALTLPAGTYTLRATTSEKGTRLLAEVSSTSGTRSGATATGVVIGNQHGVDLHLTENAGDVIAAGSLVETPDEILDFVETDGNQYIDTGVRGRCGTKADMDFMMLNTSESWFLGSRQSSSSATRIFFCYLYNSRISIGYGSQYQRTYWAFSQDTRYSLQVEFTPDGVVKATRNGSAAGDKTSNEIIDSGYNLYLFACNVGGTATGRASARCYGTKIWQIPDGGTDYVLVRNFVPCRKNGVAGLYDMVEKKIFYSKTSTALIADNSTVLFNFGHSVSGSSEIDIGSPTPENTPDYFVEWVKPSGNLFVDTGIRGKSGTKISVRFYHADADNYANIIGASASGGTQRVGVGFWGESHRYNYGSEYKGGGGAYVPYTYDYIIDQEYSASGVASSRTTHPGGRKAQDVQVEANTTDYSATQGAVDSGVSLYLFARNNGGAAADFHRGRLYECKVWQLDGNDAWQLVGNFMPCVKDGVAGVYDTVRETILYPVGNTLTAGPAKNLPSWPAAAKVGSVEHPATLWGRISYGASRGGMGNGEWKNIGLNDYALRGAGDIANLNANSGTWMSGNLAWSQLRFDGWFYVSADKAGFWTFQQGFDDYFSLTIDGVNIICNPTYNLTANTATHAITAGWHRFTIVCGDTYGGYGSGRVTLDGVKVPFTVSINGGSALAFNATNFPQGSGSNSYTLTANEDWSGRGPILLAGGAVLDLNGCQLTVKDIACDDYLGAMITNSAAKKAVLIFTGEPTASKAVADGLIRELGTKILTARVGEQSATWTGAADGTSANNAGNWVDTLTDEAVVPNANYNVKIAGTAVGLQIPAGAAFACKSFDIGTCTFTADCDWSGLSVTPTISGAANLNGHTLSLNRLAALSGAAFSNTGAEQSYVKFSATGNFSDGLTEGEFVDNIATLNLGANVKLLLTDEGGAITGTLSPGASGKITRYFQPGGAVTATQLAAGLSGSRGEFVVTNGTFTTTDGGFVFLGANGGTGVIDVGGDAVVTLAGNINAGSSLGGGSLGEIYVRGNGTLTVNGAYGGRGIGLGYNGGSNRSALIEQSGGTLNVQNSLVVGVANIGTYSQTGGALNLINGDLQVGQNSGGNGSYTMDGGTIDGKYWLHIGRNSGAVGHFTQNGGTITLNINTANDGNWVDLAEAAGGSGTYVISGGTLEVGTGAGGGGIFAGRNGSGVFVMNGGTVITPTITSGAGSSEVVLNGGTIKVARDGGTSSSRHASNIGILKDVDNLVFGNGTTIDTDGHSTSITGCGYDTVPGSSFVKAGAGTLTAAMPPVETLIVSNGVLALSAAADNRAPLTALAHRWSFTDGSLADSVGGAPDATTVPAENPALAFADGKVTMSGDGGGTGSLVLGSNLIPGANVTIEIWAQKGTVKSWSRIFEYGPDTSNVLFVPWTYGTTASRSETTLYRDGSTTGSSVRCDNYYNQEGMLHIVVRIAATGDGKAVVTTICRNSDPAATPKTATFTTPTWALAKIAGGEFYLGRSHWNDADANATYDEVRIWNGALSDEAIALSYAKGANATTADIAEIVAVDAANVSRTLDLSGGTLDLGGNTLTQPNLTGNGGTVRNGTLTVTDTIRLNVGDSIFASGTIDLTGAKVQIVDVENLATPFYFIKPAANATLNFVGKPEAVNLPKGWQISVSSGGAKITRGGFSIFLR